MRRRLRRRYSRPQTWTWIPRLSPRTLKRVGATTLVLWKQGPDWIHRKVETLTFVDDTVVRRHLSVDFTLPKDLPTPLRLPDQTPVYFVPITALRRQPGPMHFDVRDESGCALPLLNESENGNITASALNQFGTEAAGRHRLRLDGPTESALAHVPLTFFRSALQTLRALLNPHSAEWMRFPGSVATRNALRCEEDFVDFLAMCASNTLAVVPLIGTAGRRRVLKLSFEEELRQSAPEGAKVRLRDRVRIASGLRATPASVETADIGGAQSYHVQVSTPANVEMTGVRLQGFRPVDLVSQRVMDLPRPVNSATYEYTVPGFVSRAHLYIPDSTNVASGTVSVDLRAERKGLMFGAVFASLLLTSVLAVCRVRIDRLVTQPATAGSLLLIAPGLVAAYLARPGEHALARKLLVWPRAALALSAVLAFCAAVVLLLLGPTEVTLVRLPRPLAGGTVDVAAVKAASETIRRALEAIAAASGLASIFLLLSLGWPRPQYKSGT
jgi:hypothetical protein